MSEHIKITIDENSSLIESENSKNSFKKKLLNVIGTLFFTMFILLLILIPVSVYGSIGVLTYKSCSKDSTPVGDCIKDFLVFSAAFGFPITMIMYFALIGCGFLFAGLGHLLGMH